MTDFKVIKTNKIKNKMRNITETLAAAKARKAKSAKSMQNRDAVSPLPIVSPSGSARVKLDIKGRPDTTVLDLALGHDEAMTAHPTFTKPVPPQDQFQGATTDFAAKLSAVDEAKAVLAKAVLDKVASRTQLEGMLTVRASYVDSIAAGSASKILSAAMQVRGSSTPIGNLPAPLSLDVELNGTPGVMLLSWDSISGARSYLVQYSLAGTADRHWDHAVTVPTATAALADMTIGQAYAFRVAAVGGTSGQSPWSEEVTRMAA